MADEMFLGTPMYPWRVLRANAAQDADVAASLLTGFTYNQKKASCVDLHALFGAKFAGLLVAMYGDTVGAQTCDDDDTFACDMIGYRNSLNNVEGSGFNPPINIFSCATAGAKVGTARASGNGGTSETGRWMDDIALTNSEWPNGVDVFADGHNKICFIRFDCAGIRYIFPYVWDALGSNGGECPGVGMIITAY